MSAGPQLPTSVITPADQPQLPNVLAASVAVDPWSVYYSRAPLGYSETFQNGPWQGMTVGEAIAAARELGALPPGLSLQGAHVNDVLTTANNRTLFVAQEANLPVITIDDVDTSAGAKAVDTQFRLALKWGSGNGSPINPDDIPVRKSCP